MTRIVYRGRSHICREGETVLDALLRNGRSVEFSCRQGSCHACVQRATRGRPPAESQEGLSADLSASGHFLPCKCVPVEDLVIEPPLDGEAESPREEAHGTSRAKRTTQAEPDLVLWRALGEGPLMVEILTDFYTRVFADPVLGPYFVGVTRERVIGQVYSFMRDLLTGQSLYFGMKPRTAHHWMVVSDAIFDHRTGLMRETLSRHGLSDALVERWMRIEERFRGDIVKSTPWPLVIDGLEMPLDGFAEEVLSAGTMCDTCHRAIEAGERVRYHVRLGLTYCADCTRCERETTRPPATHGG